MTAFDDGFGQKDLKFTFPKSILKRVYDKSVIL